MFARAWAGRGDAVGWPLVGCSGGVWRQSATLSVFVLLQMVGMLGLIVDEAQGVQLVAQACIHENPDGSFTNRCAGGGNGFGGPSFEQKKLNKNSDPVFSPTKKKGRDPGKRVDVDS
jgi:hypothetical protein